MEHPRWGSIVCVASIKPIKTGQEIFTNYGYLKNEPPDDVPWYFEMKERFEADEFAEAEIGNIQSKSRKKKSKKKKKSVLT